MPSGLSILSEQSIQGRSAHLLHHSGEVLLQDAGLRHSVDRDEDVKGSEQV